MTINANRKERYWDTHTREDEELSQSFFHQAAIDYLMAVLKWLVFGEKIGIAHNVNFYHDALPNGVPLSPDIAVVDGLEIEERASKAERSYWVGDDGVPPRVVFEISSQDTWQIDLNEKPTKYALIGVKEYFTFDPHEPGVWTRERRRYGRLLGWRLDSAGNYQPIAKREDNWLWSEELNSWLVVEGKFLRLYTREGELRVDRAEAETRRAEQERQGREAALRQVELQSRQIEELREKIRKMGLDPDKL